MGEAHKLKQWHFQGKTLNSSPFQVIYRNRIAQHALHGCLYVPLTMFYGNRLFSPLAMAGSKEVRIIRVSVSFRKNLIPK